jgi:hypothetical protein
MDSLKCLECVTEYLLRVATLEEGTLEPGEPHYSWSEVEDAETMVPSWQQNIVGPGQMVVACVAVPACLKHIKIQKPTPQQMASRNGLIVS